MSRGVTVWSFLGAMTLFSGFVFAETTIYDVAKFSWGSNIGWISWQSGVEHDARFIYSSASGPTLYASGYIYSANVGWINLGSQPKNGIRYMNDAADDFGVNLDYILAQNAYILSGYAWGANIGWINFDVKQQAGEENQPRLDNNTGTLKGYAWGANVGWISLESVKESSANDWELYE